MYSTAFWCLIVVYCFFFVLYCVTTVTPFISGLGSHSSRVCIAVSNSPNPSRVYQAMQTRKTFSIAQKYSFIKKGSARPRYSAHSLSFFFFFSGLVLYP